MCNKCQNLHKELFDNHHLFNLDKNVDENEVKSDYPVILIEPVTLGGKIKAAVHRNIKIYSNNFENGSAYPIRAEGVENIGIYSNIFEGKSKIKIKIKNDKK